MIRVSKEQVEKLVEMGLLKQEKGRYEDLYVANRTHKGKNKTHYLVEKEEYLKALGLSK